MKALEKIEDINDEYRDSSETVRSIYYDLEDCGRNISRYVSDIYMPEIRLPRFGTKSGELRTIECDDIFIFRMFILKSL